MWINLSQTELATDPNADFTDLNVDFTDPNVHFTDIYVQVTRIEPYFFRIKDQKIMQNSKIAKNDL